MSWMACISLPVAFCAEIFLSEMQEPIFFLNLDRRVLYSSVVKITARHLSNWIRGQTKVWQGVSSCWDMDPSSAPPTATCSYIRIDDLLPKINKLCGSTYSGFVFPNCFITRHFGNGLPRYVRQSLARLLSCTVWNVCMAKPDEIYVNALEDLYQTSSARWTASPHRHDRNVQILISILGICSFVARSRTKMCSGVRQKKKIWKVTRMLPPAFVCAISRMESAADDLQCAVLVGFLVEQI